MLILIQNIHSGLLEYMCVYLQRMRFEVASKAVLVTDSCQIFMILFFIPVRHDETKSLIRW